MVRRIKAVFNQPVSVRVWKQAFFILSQSSRSFSSCVLTLLILSLPILSCGEEFAETPSQNNNVSLTEGAKYTAEDLTARLAESDVVVVGKVDACWVCQFDDPHVLYTEVLSGSVSENEVQAQAPTQAGHLPLVAVNTKLLPPNGIPIYKSAKEEICFLKREDVKRSQTPLYKVVDVWEKTPAHLHLFASRKEGL